MKWLVLYLLFIICPILSFAQTEIDEACLLMQNGYIHASFQKFSLSAKKANIAAQFYLAQCYEKGYGTNTNYSLAFTFYRKTAEKGLAVGQIALANCYQNGIGVQPSSEKAAYWREKAQGKYNPELLTYLDALYQEGLKHPENYAMNPNYTAINNNGSVLLAQNTGNINSNNVVGSNNSTVNNITIIQQAPVQQNITQPAVAQPQESQSAEQQLHKSDVDGNIPENTSINETTFAIIIANENYHDVAKVPNALNDGEIFTEYCKKCLGLPSSNVRLVKDATLNNIKREVNQLKQIAEAYKGEAKFVFYYAGHGIPDEATKDAYLLPVDGYGTDISTGYSLNQLYKELGGLESEQVIVFLDACFSGTQRGNGMLATARGVAIKAKPSDPFGKMVVLSAAQGDETAYPFEEQHHGLFTYYLLKKLKDTKGTVSMGELADYIKDNVSKKSIVANGKSQTPTVSASAAVGESWKTWKLNQ